MKQIRITNPNKTCPPRNTAITLIGSSKERFKGSGWNNMFEKADQWTDLIELERGLHGL